METKKRIYVGLLGASLLVLVLVIALLWYLFNNHQLLVNQVLLTVIVTLAGVMLLMLGIGITAIVIMIIRGKPSPLLEMLSRFSNDVLFPLAVMIGKIFGIKREKVLGSFIAVNNFLVSGRIDYIRPEKILILLPHCIQNSDCPHKITIDINNCKNCGKCKIGELKEMAAKYGANIKVATGGTLARKFTEDVRPQGIVAVACERDLSAGIQDSGPLPVIGVLNCRPNGPCINTDVSLSAVENAIKTICHQ
ncbi:MAG TPA: DUF116 domain-containing protein [Syntrophomonadaceae bacterium]|nr:DUF116 domain-containing protein [Syntrophomonadaceae bacterium]HNX29008.1 DUF116 domain-containing protein [Syntrophomonadaceae bacterium]HPR93764.1 DUF116 domain-containing protein [Syntrophomonadaceae bacterium]